MKLTIEGDVDEIKELLCTTINGDEVAIKQVVSKDHELVDAKHIASNLNKKAPSKK